MVETKLSPVSIRLNEEDVERIKQTARIESARQSKDISYVDLIRQCISKEFAVACGDDGSEEVLQFICLGRSFWTQDRIDKLNSTATGEKLQNCVSSGDYSSYEDISRKTIQLWIDRRSLARRILTPYRRERGDPVVEIDRDLAVIAHVISLRGSVPHQITEGEKFRLPEFEIANKPSIRNADLSPKHLISTLGTTCHALQWELDLNVLNALSHAADARGDQVIVLSSNYPCKDIDAGTIAGGIQRACKSIVQHGIPPAYIIMHPNVYMDLGCTGIGTLRESFAANFFGQMIGTEILVSTKCDPKSILVVAEPDELGVLVQRGDIFVKHVEECAKRRQDFVNGMEVGIAIINDWGVAKVKLGKDE